VTRRARAARRSQGGGSQRRGRGHRCARIPASSLTDRGVSPAARRCAGSTCPRSVSAVRRRPRSHSGVRSPDRRLRLPLCPGRTRLAAHAASSPVVANLKRGLGSGKSRSSPFTSDCRPWHRLCCLNSSSHIAWREEVQNRMRWGRGRAAVETGTTEPCSGEPGGKPVTLSLISSTRGRSRRGDSRVSRILSRRSSGRFSGGPSFDRTGQEADVRRGAGS